MYGRFRLDIFHCGYYSLDLVIWGGGGDHPRQALMLGPLYYSSYSFSYLVTVIEWQLWAHHSKHWNVCTAHTNPKKTISVCTTNSIVIIPERLHIRERSKFSAVLPPSRCLFPCGRCSLVYFQWRQLLCMHIEVMWGPIEPPEGSGRVAATEHTTLIPPPAQTNQCHHDETEFQRCCRRWIPLSFPEYIFSPQKVNSEAIISLAQKGIHRETTTMESKETSGLIYKSYESASLSC